jgi:hypothetical protein
LSNISATPTGWTSGMADEWCSAIFHWPFICLYRNVKRAWEGKKTAATAAVAAAKQKCVGNYCVAQIPSQLFQKCPHTVVIHHCDSWKVQQHLHASCHSLWSAEPTYLQLVHASGENAALPSLPPALHTLNYFLSTISGVFLLPLKVKL